MAGKSHRFRPRVGGVPAWTGRALLCSAVLAWPDLAAAQSASQVLPPTREEVTRPAPPAPDSGAPRLEVVDGVERSPCALAAPQYAAIRLTLTEATFDGLKVISPEALRPAWEPFVGQDQPVAVVCEIRDRAAHILREAGYVASVQVPEQEIDGGRVRFDVVMARLTRVQVRGPAEGAERVIAAYLDNLTNRPVFNRFEAERYLMLASDLPGYAVRLALRPAGTGPGEVIGDVTVNHIPLLVDANVQNYGSRELGRFGGLLRAQLFGLTGMGDRTILSAFSTADLHEQQSFQLGHDFRIGGEGLALGGLLTYAIARPDLDDAGDVKAKTLLGTFEMSYPFVRRQAQSLRGVIGMDIVNQDVDLGSIDLTRDRLRVAFAKLGFEARNDDYSAGFSAASPRWRFTGSLEFRQGLHIFGATKSCGPLGADCLLPGEVPPSRLEGRSNATVIRGGISGEARPLPKLTFALKALGQYAWKPLLSFEEFAVGNFTVGRGYDPGTLLGDRGFGTQAEIRVGSTVPQTQRDLAIEGYGFWDQAMVRNRDKLLVIDQREHVHSVGGGLRLAFAGFALDTTLAVPLSRVGVLDRKPDPRLLVSLSALLWPWRPR